MMDTGAHPAGTRAKEVGARGCAAAPEPSLAAGTVVGERYRVRRRIGQGGMGTVYLAEHVHIERLVALKVLSPALAARPEIMRGFLKEGRALGRIVHDNVVEIYDFGETADSAFLAMEYLVGADLAEVLRDDGPLPPGRVAALGRQICRGLAAAHERGVVHRDLKPANIFLVEGPDGGPDGEAAKLLDFGLAKVAESGAGPGRPTVSGGLLGTPEYMAPEQARGEPVDARADLYALGCILYEALTGTPPFTAESAVGVLGKHLFAAPSPLEERAAPPWLAAACLRALEKDPARRFQSAEEMREALEGAAPAAALAPSAGTRPVPAIGTRPVPVLGTGPVAIVGAVSKAALETTQVLKGGAPIQPVRVPARTAAPTSALPPAPTFALPPARRRPRPRGLPMIGLGLAVAAGLLWHLRQPLHPALQLAPAAHGPAPRAAAPPPPAEPAPPPEASASEPPAHARLVLRGGPAGAAVLLNGRQLLGHLPLEVAVPMVAGVPREAGSLLVRRAGCADGTVPVELVAGGAVERAVTLSCRRPSSPRARGPSGEEVDIRDPFTGLPSR